MKVESVEAVARALNERDVDYIVVGGLAVVTYGYGRLTQDVDLVVRLATADIFSAFSALAELGYHPRIPVTAEDFADEEQRRRWIEEKGMAVLNFHSDQHRETPVDIFVEEPFDFDLEYREALVQEVASDVHVRIVRLPTLVEMKERVGRPQDLADVAQLRSIHEELK